MRLTPRSGLIALCVLPHTFSFQFRQQRKVSFALTTSTTPRRAPFSSTALGETNEARKAVSSQSGAAAGAEINGIPTAASANNLILAKDAKSQLFSAFAALDLSDQYDAVLTGLCAKIMDNKNLNEEQTKQALNDPIQLVKEMNTKRIPASPRSLMALIDATVRTQDARTMATTLSLCSQTAQGIKQYGSQQRDILLLPNTPTSRIRCPDGSIKTRAERLANLPDVPFDEREREATYAVAFGGLVLFCSFTNLFGMDDISPYANAFLTLVVTVGVVDNFYDVLKTTTQFISTQIQNYAKKGDKGVEIKELNLPAKDSLPFGLGSGKLTGSTVRGLTRLLTVDAERESQCEAAALYAAFVLGLPCFAFRPNAYEGSVLVLESMQDKSLAPLLSSSGILRMLVWLMAPVAMESSLHPQLIMSDPREASGFLDRLDEFADSNPATAKELWWRDASSSEQERNDLLKWAYTEADLLLRDNRAAVKEVSNRLTGGAATIGDCVAAIEKW